MATKHEQSKTLSALHTQLTAKLERQRKAFENTETQVKALEAQIKALGV